MKKKTNFCRLLSVAVVCSLCLLSLPSSPASAAEPPPASGGGGGVVTIPSAVVDYCGLLDGNSHFYYGNYHFPVMGNYSYGVRPMLYKIMGEEEGDGHLTLMSRYLISNEPYSSTQAGQHYDDSYIRDWLNNGFFSGAFSECEQGAIVETQVKTSVFEYGIEKTGPVSIMADGPVGNYPLTTYDKIYLPWGNPAEDMAYWSSSGAAGSEYQVSQPTTMKGENSTYPNVYNRLRTPSYDPYHGYIGGPLLFGCYASGNNLVTQVHSSWSSYDFIYNCGIFPVFKIDAEKVIFTSLIVPTGTEGSGSHQIKESSSYTLPETGNAYKLTILDEALDELAGSIYSGADLVGAGNTLKVGMAGSFDLGMSIPNYLGKSYSIRYKLLDGSGALVGYGGRAGPLSSGMNGFSLDAVDLDGQPLADGTYSAFAWLQRDNATTSFAASAPQHFCITVNSPPKLSGGSAARSSNSNATINFSSDKDGICYYVVLPKDDTVPDASTIKGMGEAATDMIQGTNTVNLSKLTAGTWKICIVGEDSSGESNVLSVAIPAYVAPSPLPPQGGGGSGTVIAKPEVPLTDPVSFPPFVQGFEDNTFRGDGLMTREQFVAILARLNNNEPAPAAKGGTQSFGDVTFDRWSYNAVEWAQEKGIAEPDAEGNFRPAAPLTRAEMAVMFVRVEKLTEAAEDTFGDIHGYTSADDILKAVKAGIFTGYSDGTFKPEGNTTRNEAVAALIRYLLGKEPPDAMWQGTALAFNDVVRTHWAYKYITLAVNGYTGTEV
ncbi:MAG: S-layer homology domain-containing protein [Clostridiales bacterium]|nr:S-layer homology domain-containing protein [Clostridiales bacterium]